MRVTRTTGMSLCHFESLYLSFFFMSLKNSLCYVDVTFKLFAALAVHFPIVAYLIYTKYMRLFQRHVKI
jgi:hypothetical protein